MGKSVKSEDPILQSHRTQESSLPIEFSEATKRNTKDSGKEEFDCWNNTRMNVGRPRERQKQIEEEKNCFALKMKEVNDTKKITNAEKEGRI